MIDVAHLQRTRLAVIVAFLCAAAIPAAAVDEGQPAVDKTPGLRSGAWELGVNASLVSRSGAATASLALFSNRYWVRRGIPLSAGAAVSYTHVSDLDQVDVEARVAVYRRLAGSSAYGYVGLGGGVRQEWVGSFAQARYPLGAAVGLKALLSPRAAITVAYQFRRLLDDPVADFSEHRFITGISILFL
jgi:hypothetical protein